MGLRDLCPAAEPPGTVACGEEKQERVNIKIKAMGKNDAGTIKRRNNILYKLRRKGVRCDTKARTIELPYGSDPEGFVQVGRLRREYRFNVQFVII